jgi:hypothetical protein
MIVQVVHLSPVLVFQPPRQRPVSLRAGENGWEQAATIKEVRTRTA